MIIKNNDKSRLKNEVPRIKVNIKDVIKDIIVNNRYLIDLDMDRRKYNKLMSMFIDDCQYDGICDCYVYCPSNYINTYILSSLISNVVRCSYSIMRSLDVGDVAFGKSDKYRNIGMINEKYLFIILDSQISDYLQTTIIQLYENRRMKGLRTVIISEYEIDVSSYDIIDGFFYPDGSNIRSGMVILDIYDIIENNKSKKKGGN